MSNKVEEKKLRVFVRKYLTENHAKKLQEQKQTLKEETILRTAIRKLLQEKESVVPGASTGINELESVLTSIIPAIESDYKKLTSSEEQRKSYRAHIIRAAIDILLAADAAFEADQEGASISKESIPAAVKQDLPPEATENLQEAIQPQYNPELVKKLQIYLSKYFNYSDNSRAFFKETRASENALQPTGRLGSARDPNSTQYLINWMRTHKSPKGFLYLPARKSGSIDDNLEVLIRYFESSDAVKKIVQQNKQPVLPQAPTTDKTKEPTSEQVPGRFEPNMAENLREQEEKGIDIKIGDEKGGDDAKLIDVDTNDKPDDKEKTKEEQTEESFTIPGQDLTGRNIALRTWNKRGIGTTIKNGYKLLELPRDRKIFFDYLLTNLKLYFDRFEKDLQGMVKEPTTSAYEKIKQTGQSYEGGQTAIAEGKKPKQRLVESNKLSDQILAYLLK